MFYIKTSGPDHLTEKHTFSRSRQIFLNEMELEKHSTCQLIKGRMLHLARTALNILKINLLISFPSWLTLWKDTINPQWPVHYSDYYTFIVLLLIEIVQFNSSVSEIESGTAYGKKKQSKNTEKRKQTRKSISTSYYNGPWGGFVYIRSFLIQIL